METNTNTHASAGELVFRVDRWDRPLLRRGSAGFPFLCVLVILSCLFSPVRSMAGSARAYQCGFTLVLKLGGDLSESLPAKFSDKIDAQAIALEPEESPVVTPLVTTTDTNIQRQVTLSAGFIDLLNHICHARAVDNIEPGFFNRYVRILAESGDGEKAQAPGIVDPRYWSEKVINDQMSYFNQMIGFIMAVNMSHLYLGHYAKYSSRMVGPDDKLIPINSFLTPEEWDVSVRAAAVDSLNCALATDGSRALFDAIDRMPHRPAWAAYIVPANVDLKKLNKQLVCYERDFFRGQLK